MLKACPSIILEILNVSYSDFRFYITLRCGGHDVQVGLLCGLKFQICCIPAVWGEIILISISTLHILVTSICVSLVVSLRVWSRKRENQSQKSCLIDFSNFQIYKYIYIYIIYIYIIYILYIYYIYIIYKYYIYIYYIYIYIYMYACMHVCMYVCMYVDIVLISLCLQTPGSERVHLKFLY